MSLRTHPGAPAALLAGALLVAAVSLGVVAARAGGEPHTFGERVRSVAEDLRCPVCQGLSVADSPSSLARQMRASIARDLRAGRTPDEIKASLVDSYGEWILLAPSGSGLNLVAWVAPALLFAAGLVVAVVAIRRWTLGSPVRARTVDRGAGQGDGGLSGSDRALLDRATAAFREGSG